MIIIPQNPSPAVKRGAGSFLLTCLAVCSALLLFGICAAIYYGGTWLIRNVTVETLATTAAMAVVFAVVWLVIWREMKRDGLFDE